MAEVQMNLYFFPNESVFLKEVHFIEKMEGYDQYAWNQWYGHNEMVYHPQHQDFLYDNGRSYEYNYQMPYDSTQHTPWC
ncbi:hypothetical protein ACS0TY_020148 [Phlomoides rotata]